MTDSSIIIPAESDPDLAEYNITHDAIQFDIVGQSIYITQPDINGGTAIQPGEAYDSIISFGRGQAEAMYFALGRLLGMKGDTN